MDLAKLFGGASQAQRVRARVEAGKLLDKAAERQAAQAAKARRTRERNERLMRER